MSTRTQYYPFGGGLDAVTPALSINPGRALALVNHEPWLNGGYRRIPGYERFDGRPKPSAATFVGFEVDDSTGMSLGDTLTGDTSGATGIVIGINGNEVGVTKVSGTFQINEDLNTSTYTIETTPTTSDVSTVALFEAWRKAAEEEYRDDIDEVPGSGNTLGVWQRKADVYAVRDNAGDTAGILHRASSSGWTTSGITMGEYIFFDAGSANGPFEEGDTVTGATSGASATVHRVVLLEGAWDGSGVGYLVVTGVTSGPFQNNENLQVSASTYAVADGANTAFALAKDGDYRFINHNFYANSDRYCVYGVSAVGPAFEIDENHIVSPILFQSQAPSQAAKTGEPSSNVPFLVEEHRNYLFLAFPDGSLQHSVQGEPLNFSGFLGAAEFGVGDDITGINSMSGGVLAISSERETRGLYGTGTSDWELRVLAEKSGAVLHTAHSVDTLYSINALGITSLARTEQFGDFVGSTVSQLVQPILEERRTVINDATVVRKSNQYRIYFDDNAEALVMHVPGPGSAGETRGTNTRTGVEFGMLIYDHTVKRIYNCDDENGVERIYFVSDDGYVYEDQIGRNFDGEPIRAWARLAFNQIGSPTWRKRFRRADIELSALNSLLTIRALQDLTYSTPDVGTDTLTLNLVGGGGYWDSANWDQFNFDAQPIVTARLRLTGTGQNIGFVVESESDTAEPWVLEGVTIHFDIRRLQR